MFRILINHEKIIHCNPGDNLYQVLSKHGYIFTGNCGGNGICRKCLVTMQNNGEVIKSCQYTVSSDIEILLEDMQKTDQISVLTDYRIDNLVQTNINSDEKFDEISDHNSAENHSMLQENTYGLAVDLGTTTIATELVHLGTGETIDTASILNSQITKGADVISRIQLASDKEGLQNLQHMVKQDISGLFFDLLSKHPEAEGHIIDCMIAGNTTMLSILAGITTENLGSYPFDIKNPDAMYIPYTEFFSKNSQMLENQKAFMEKLTLLPNISAFIGADIAAGAIALRLNRDKKYRLLIDLGTNGELLLCNHEHGFAAGTACGPAFEGYFRSKSFHGSNLFDMLALLRKRKICNTEGILTEQYFESGVPMGQGICIDMDLIRSFQLAKSAICSGIQILLEQANLTEEDVSEVYISGGFGFHLNISNAIYLGLIPKAFEKKIMISGNTSLAGAKLALLDNDFIDNINKLKQTITTIHLGDTEGYTDLFVKNLNFPER